MRTSEGRAAATVGRKSTNLPDTVRRATGTATKGRYLQTLLVNTHAPSGSNTWHRWETFFSTGLAYLLRHTPHPTSLAVISLRIRTRGLYRGDPSAHDAVSTDTTIPLNRRVDKYNALTLLHAVYEYWCLQYANVAHIKHTQIPYRQLVVRTVAFRCMNIIE